MKIALLFLSLPLLIAAAPTSLQFLDPGTQIIPMANGNTLTWKLTTPPGSPVLFLNDASGNQIASLPATSLGAGATFTGAAVDKAGNIWITGSTGATASTVATGVVVEKLSPNFSVLSTIALQGQPVNGQTSLSSIAFDKSGNAYVVGGTNDSNFPATGPNFGTGSPSSGALGRITFTFIAEIAADGSRLIYSRLLGGTMPYCPNGGSSCFLGGTGAEPSAVAVDQDDSVVVAGETNANNFPVTVTPYASGRGAFIARIAPGGSQLEWSTQIGSIFMELGASVQALLLDSSGNVYIAGNSHGPITGTPNALQPTYPKETIGVDVSTAFVMKLSPDGTQLLYATNLVGSQGSNLAGATFDSSGNLWAAGFTASPDFPGLSNVSASGVDFALELNADASAITQIFSFLPGTIASQFTFDPSGRMFLPGATGTLLHWNLDPTATTSAVFGLTNSAVPSSMTGGAPGELATFYGVGLGPSTGIAATPDANGNYPTTLGGVTVGFSAGFAVIPARLLYVGPNQINFQVPFELSATTPVIVTTPTGPLPALPFHVLSSVGIFGVINPDGSINSQSNAAPVGSAVAIYATGLGAPEPSSLDGAISTTADNAFINAVRIDNLLGPSQTLPVLYAGTAPTLINGLDQINVQLPSRQTPQIQIQTTNGNSNQITIYTH